LQDFYISNEAAINSAGSALPLAVTLDVQSIERTITKFAQTSAIIMKGLETLEKVHPFIGVAVLPFKLMISLDVTRRQNNKKVLAVQIQMQDMMTVLFQLRNIRDSTEKGSRGISLKDNMSSIIEIVANTITECGSACDVYLKKHLLIKTVMAKIYESRFAGFVKSFHQHKKTIQFILGMHASQGVAEANLKLDSQTHHWETIETQMGELLRRLNSTQEEEGRKLIEQEGGPYMCVNNDAALQQLLSKIGMSTHLDLAHFGSGGLASVKKVLNKELAEDLDEVFQKNMKFFDRKLQRQEKRLRNELTRTREMILDALARGPHQKIVDEDLQKIWEDQDWKGSVKARYFALALTDFYSDRFSKVDMRYAKTVVASVPGTQPEDDSWVLAYITVMRMQPILEAVDDDGSGFVSIKEANDFARLRPTGWSLPAWVAFWAAGWHMTVTWYKNAIYKILKAMMRLLPHLKLVNIQAADTYFAGPAIRRVELLLRSTRSGDSNAHKDMRLVRLANKFKAEEEEWMSLQLEDLHYVVDDVSTIPLITGPGRIERYVYPLVYLLLKRHFDILRLACLHTLDESEFITMTTSLVNIFKAVNMRTNSLEAIFKSNSMDVKERLGHFAFGMLGHGKPLRDPINNTIRSFEEED
ncbi:hypothetical protein B0H13DRAFT_1543536, partial [Mycena leptocephala]